MTTDLPTDAFEIISLPNGFNPNILLHITLKKLTNRKRFSNNFFFCNNRIEIKPSFKDSKMQHKENTISFSYPSIENQRGVLNLLGNAFVLFPQ